jgi:hypothetical protein
VIDGLVETLGFVLEDLSRDRILSGGGVGGGGGCGGRTEVGRCFTEVTLVAALVAARPSVLWAQRGN